MATWPRACRTRGSRRWSKACRWPKARPTWRAAFWSGLKEPLPAAPAEFLKFRVVLTAVPVPDVPAKLLLARLGARLDNELAETSQRRILAVPSEDLLA